MSVWPADALFEEVGIGAVLEHVGVVVAFDEDAVERADDFVERVEWVSEVGEDSEALFSCGDDKGDAVGCVVGGGNGFDGETVKGEGVACREVAEVVHFAECATVVCGAEGFFGEVNGEAVFALVDAGTADMVAVVVGDDDCGDVPNVASVRGEALFGFDAADACVEEQGRAIGFNVDAVTCAAGLEGDGFHGGQYSIFWSFLIKDVFSRGGKVWGGVVWGGVAGLGGRAAEYSDGAAGGCLACADVCGPVADHP